MHQQQQRCGGRPKESGAKAVDLFPATDRQPGANTLLAYFHYCNKAIYPFSAECKDQDLQSLAALNDEAISFVHYIRRFAAEHSEQTPDTPPPVGESDTMQTGGDDANACVVRRACRKGMGRLVGRRGLRE